MRATDSDAGDDITGYAITGGADRAFFSIGATSGALTFDAAPNFEDAKDIVSVDPANAAGNNTYVVEVTATSGTGEREKTAEQTITVTVTDVAGEAPGKPAAPTVAPASVSRLTVMWSAPSNAGPAITDYDVQYRAGTSGGWTDGGHVGTALTATLTGLSENTSYQVQVRATNDEGTGSWSDAGTGTTEANAAPAFTSDAAFDAAENQTSAGEVVAADSDSEDSITGYAITGGADQAFFSIGASLGALTFKTAPNFEDAQDIVSVDQANAAGNNQYVVEVTATSGTGERVKTVTQTITVTVTDVNTEAPGKPAAPTVAPASVSRLTVMWSAPSNAGPAITDYDVQYRAGTSGDWSDGSHVGTALTATLTGLSENTSYQVQVRATNDEGTGAWSASGSGTTDANAAPSFSSPATFDAAENQTAVGTVVATDSDADDDITGYAITGGADEALFEIGTDGTLTFKTAPNFEDAKDIVSVDQANAAGNNQYVVEVTATSGTGERVKTVTQTITVTVTDVNTEAPGKPAAPAVVPASVSRLTVNWSAPANAGPAITDYDVQYRAGTSGDWSDGSHAGAALTATLTGLSENTSYQVQVRATNDEGTGAWSASGSGTTDANAAPSFSSPATFDAAENQTAVGTVVATDSDADDDITGYAITGGADEALFEIGTDGTLTFKTAPNFEDAKDIVSVDQANAAGNNQYVVEVTATSGTGERVKTVTQTITVTVTDVNTEAPGKPAAPAVSPASGMSLMVNWTAPANAGPAITDYDVQYRAGTSGDWSDGSHAGAALTATLTGLSENTSYQVQVRATNDEGTGAWSDAGSGATDADAVEVPGVEGELRLDPETEVGYSDVVKNRYDGKIGRVEVFHAGRWGTVCSDGIKRSKVIIFEYNSDGKLILDSKGKPKEIESDNEAAALICQSWGYDTGEYFMKYSKYRPGAAVPEHQDAHYWAPDSSYPEDGPMPIWLDDLTCVAGEPVLEGEGGLRWPLSHCGYAGWGLHNCTHKEDAVVRCWRKLAAKVVAPATSGLAPNFPNPFNRRTLIPYRLATSGAVRLAIYNLLGQPVRTLVNQDQDAGFYTVRWDARDAAARRVSSGVYFLRLHYPGGVQTRRMLYLE